MPAAREADMPPPLWEDSTPLFVPRKWVEVGTTAVEPRPGESPPSLNKFRLVLSTADELHRRADRILRRARKVFDFDFLSGWGDQQGFFYALVKTFCPDDCPFPAWMSLMTCRRLFMHSQTDPSVTVRQSAPEDLYEDPDVPGDAVGRGTLEVAPGVRVPGSGLAMDYKPDAPAGDALLTRCVYRREIAAPDASGPNLYRETRVFLGRKGEDDKTLAAGLLPASDAPPAGSPPPVRKVFALSLGIVTPHGLWVSVAVELQPGSARVVSFRSMRPPLEAVLRGSPHVHKLLQEAIGNRRP